MKHGLKEAHGYYWPASDTEASSVVVANLVDLDIALRYVRTFGTVVQAGGNVGVWPKYLAQRFAGVYTFEPEPTNWECLLLNCHGADIVRFNYALGERSGYIGIGYPEGRANMGACCVENYGVIPMTTIDSFDLPACDFIQLDIEGYEPWALRGARRTIDRFHPVLMLEDKGLSVKYGVAHNWTDHIAGYRVVERINRDVVLVWDDREDNDGK